MKVKQIATMGNVNAVELENWLRANDKYNKWLRDGLMGCAVDDHVNPQDILNDYKREQAAYEMERSAEEARRRAALESMILTSGSDLDGCRIRYYGDLISGDGVVQIDRSKFKHIGRNRCLENALRDARGQAIAELKNAAYALNCNAIVGVRFNYFTMSPQIPDSSGAIPSMTYEPYVICVTVSGNAVIIEERQ